MGKKSGSSPLGIIVVVVILLALVGGCSDSSSHSGSGSGGTYSRSSSGEYSQEYWDAMREGWDRGINGD